MFCPKCSAYVTEKELIKTDVKYAPGNVPIEYDAICPHCRVEMGKVSWGQLTVDPALEAKLKKEAEMSKPSETASADTEQVSAEKTCPHCGKPLPEGY